MSHIPSMVLVSGKDEYVPEYVDVVSMGHRIAKAMGGNSTVAVVEEAVHNLQGSEEEAVQIISKFVADICC